MLLEDAANRLAELGNTTRLRIYRHLVEAGPEGMPVGELQKELEVPASTLSHHVSRLVRVGLVRQERESQVLRCHPEYPALQELIDYLQSECCARSDCGEGGCS